MKRSSRKFVVASLVAVFILLAYIIGAVSSRLDWFPIPQLLKLRMEKSAKDERTNKYFSNYFLSNKPAKSIYPPIKNLSQLDQQLQRYEVRIDNWDSAYAKLTIKSLQIEDELAKVIYSYQGQVDTAFAYFNASKHTASAPKLGSLVIPGSGRNQSYAIFSDDIAYQPKNYQNNIDNVLGKYGDVFVYIKPNEDILALHNGENKLNENGFIFYLLNKGYSFSSYWLLQTFAFTKAIQANYEKSLVSGISQGGLASLFNAINCNPDYSIVASGYSELMKFPFESGVDQIIIPGYSIHQRPQEVRDRVSSIETKMLFTWGGKENGLFGQDVIEKSTEQLFMGLENVTCHYHRSDHQYDEESILNFLKKELE